MSAPAPRRRSKLADANPLGTPAMPTQPAKQAEPTKPVMPEVDDELIVKVTLRLPADLAGKVRMAFATDMPTTGVTSLSKWVAAVLQKEIDHREETQGELGQLPAGGIVRGWSAR